MKSLGIYMSASTLSAVDIDRDEKDQIHKISVQIRPRNGNPRGTFLETLINIGVGGYDKIAVTGREFRNTVNLSSSSEPEAVEAALTHLNGDRQDLDAIISVGGETFMVYVLGKDEKSGNGRIFSSTIQENRFIHKRCNSLCL